MPPSKGERKRKSAAAEASSSKAPKRVSAAATAAATPARRTRTVRFPDSPTSGVVTATATKHITRRELYNEIQHTENVLIHFFKRRIGDITDEWSQHRKGDANTDEVDQSHNKSICYVHTSMAATPEDKFNESDSLGQPTLRTITCGILKVFRDRTPQHLLIYDINHKFTNRAVHIALIALMRGALFSFLNFNNCRNACPAAMDYPTIAAVPVPDPSKPETQLHAKPYGVANKDIYAACNKSHRRLEAALVIPDIRYLDAIVREASRGKCGLAFA